MVSVRTFVVMPDILFFFLQVPRSDTRPHGKWEVSLVISLIILRGLCRYMYVWVNKYLVHVYR